MIEIPGYTLLHKLGRGGMGEVHLALQQSLGRQVALKLLTPEMEHDERARERFVREARIAANLHHQHIVPIHDVGVHEGIAYIAMEYEPGGTIGELAHEALEPGKALRIAREVAAALDYAHRQGVVHRDVKPENVLRRADGLCLLSDFGISRAREQPTIVSQEGHSVGTPQYMSPEQLRGQELDGRSDLYSLGVMLYQLLTGTLPFEGADLWAIGTQHVSAPIPYLPEHLAHVQPLVDALMAKEPDARPKSGAEVVARIEALLASSQRAALTPALTQPMVGPAAEQPSSFNKSHRVGLIAGLALAVLALALVLTQSRPWRAREPAAGSTTPAPVAPSIAVLPFVDMSQDKDQEYFSDGLSEELLDRLANIPQLKVAGRTSSFSFKGRGDDLKEIGSKLGVSHVLEGSVRKSGDRLRVTAQLISVADGFHQWSSSYDRQLTEVFAVQDEIAAAVVDALQVKLLPGQQVARTHHRPGPEAYDQYLLGRHGLSIRSGDFVPAVEAFSRAVALEPDYALAYAYLGMAESFVSESTKGDAAKVDTARARARAAADKAVQLDPGLADGYSTRGYLRYTHDWDWSGARADLEFALKLDLANELTYLKYGYLLAMLGKLPEAIAAERRATELDPMLLPPWETLGKLYLATGDYEAARRALNRAHAIAPESSRLGLLLPQVDLLEGRSEEALAGYERTPPGRWRLIGTAIAQYQLGRKEAAQSALKELIDRHGKDYPCRVAGVLARLGDSDQAFQWLERAYEQHDVTLGEIQFDALLAPIRGDPRYQALLDKMQFPR